MPKVTNTRRQRAAELLRRIKDGPSLFMGQEKIGEKEFKARYSNWAGSWIVHELTDLIPELRAVKKKARPHQ